MMELVVHFFRSKYKYRQFWIYRHDACGGTIWAAKLGPYWHIADSLFEIKRLINIYTHNIPIQDREIKLLQKSKVIGVAPDINGLLAAED